jgi:hypothetical protein
VQATRAPEESHGGDAEQSELDAEVRRVNLLAVPVQPLIVVIRQNSQPMGNEGCFCQVL